VGKLHEKILLHLKEVLGKLLSLSDSSKTAIAFLDVILGPIADLLELKFKRYLIFDTSNANSYNIVRRQLECSEDGVTALADLINTILPELKRHVLSTFRNFTETGWKHDKQYNLIGVTNLATKLCVFNVLLKNNEGRR
jgi:hypothetical protein